MATSKTTSRLVAIARHELVYGLFAAVIVFVALGGSEWSLFVKAVVVALTVVVVTLVARIARVWELLFVASEGHGRAHRVASEFMIDEACRFVDQHYVDLVSGWFEADREQLERLVGLAFKRAGSGRYRGTDSHTPTQFASVYPYYLARQLGRRVDRHAEKADFRFLLVSEEILLADMRSNPEVALAFVRSHLVTDSVRLLVVAPQIARDLVDNQGLPSTDIGVFANSVAVFFRPNREAGTVSVQIREVDEELRKKLSSYLLSLNLHANAVGLVGEHVEIVAREG